MILHTLTLVDEADTLGLGGVTVIAVLHCSVDPGDPGCWRDANGDGYPAIPATADLDAIVIDAVFADTGVKVPVTRAVEDRVRTWVDEQAAKNWDTIEAEVLEDAT